MRMRNWKKFQHYKRRKPPWIRLYKDLLEDPQWCCLDSDARCMLASCWLLASEDKEMSGLLPDIATIAFKLRMTEENVARQISKINHWVEDASKMLAPCLQLAPPETETETETEAEGETVAANAAPALPKGSSGAPKKDTIVAGPGKRGTRLPEGWRPDRMDDLLGEGFSIGGIEMDLLKFRDYWAAVPGARGVKLDWEATFRNWVRRSAEFNRRHSDGDYPQSGRDRVIF
jgi:hypothetical protein